MIESLPVEPSRVLILMPELYAGGAETQFRYVIDGLVDRGYEVVVVVERSYGTRDQSAENDFIEHRRHKVNFVLLTGLNVREGYAMRAISTIRVRRAFKRLLSSERPDIAIVYSGLGATLLPLFARLKIPAVFSERNSGRYPRFRWLTQGRYLRKAREITANSVHAVDSLRGHGLDVLHVANGVQSPAQVRDYAASPPERPLRILVPARVAPIKGQSVVIEALRTLQPGEIRVVFAGSVEDSEYAARLMQGISELDGVAEYVGPVFDMHSAYLQSDIVVLPSFSEGMPNVLLEAMVRGIVVIASDIPPNRAVVTDGHLLFQSGSASSLAERLAFFATLDSTEWQRIAYENRRRVSDTYGVDRMVNYYADRLDRILERRES